MSYALSSALQAAVYQALIADADLTALVGTSIFDALPAGTPPALYVALGPESVRDASDMSGKGAIHSFTISVFSQNAGFQTAKDVAARVSDVLIDAALTLERGSLVSLGFDRASAKRVSGGARQIDLRFRARVDDN